MDKCPDCGGVLEEGYFYSKNALNSRAEHLLNIIQFKTDSGEYPVGGYLCNSCRRIFPAITKLSLSVKKKQIMDIYYLGLGLFLIIFLIIIIIIVFIIIKSNQ